ncbi:MAG: AraC family transcriptional regulator ligand-binding domain-containing protein [Pseudomonadota bacterium]
MNHYWQAGDACIRAQDQPALVLDYAHRRELAERLVFPGTGLDGWDLPDADHTLTPEQYLRLLSNVAAGLKSADTSFQLGQHMLPGHFGNISHALTQAHSLRDAIGMLRRYQLPLSPLLAPRFAEEGGLGIVYWTPGFGVTPMQGFVLEMQMTAFSAMCRWLSGEKLPWRFCFNRTQPRYIEQFEVHLGPRLRFNCQLDAMLIDAVWLDHPWPRGNATAAAIALRHAPPKAEQRALLSAVHDYLLENIRRSPTLEETATAFAVSPATLKRHLARHGSHFQAELDQVRAHVALMLMHRGHDNDAVARHLGYHDANNFRRSFKRWTGMTPLLSRQGIQAFMA